MQPSTLKTTRANISSVLIADPPKYKKIKLSNIKDLCIRHPNKIRLMWVTGHAGIEECADRTAKTHMYIIPSIMAYSALNSDISKMMDVILQNKKTSDWRKYNHRYFQINVDAVFARSCCRNKSKIMVRLRMGHTQLTHDYILSGGSKPTCFF